MRRARVAPRIRWIRQDPGASGPCGDLHRGGALASALDLSVVRTLTNLFAYEHEPQLGLYGAFGYDLTFQFEVKLHQKRDPSQRDLVLYLLDEILVIDILQRRVEAAVRPRRARAARRRAICRARARSRTRPRPRRTSRDAVTTPRVSSRRRSAAPRRSSR